MDQTRPDVSDTQPLPTQVPAADETRHDPPERGRRPRAAGNSEETAHDLPRRERRPRPAGSVQEARTDLPAQDERARPERTRQMTGHGLPPQAGPPSIEQVEQVETDPSRTHPSRTDPSRPSRTETLGERARHGQVTLRFGPGVPADVAELWRDGARTRPRRTLSRRIAGGALTVGVALLAALVVWWLLRGGGPAVRVTGVSVQVPKRVQHCDTTVRVVGTIRTNGGRGDVTYRWRRSDGQVSGVFTETLHKGQRSVRVPLRWTIKGTGTLHAVATLEVVTPRSPAGQAWAGFTYVCG